ncbi:hypothetical protein NFI96_030247, partial [Prochilodus magdalenae]
TSRILSAQSLLRLVFGAEWQGLVSPYLAWCPFVLVVGWQDGRGANRAREQPTVIIKSHQDHKEIVIGDTVTLKCEVPGGGGRAWTYIWYRNGEVLPSQEKSKFTFQVTEHDDAQYTCKGITRASNPVTLPIADPPTATLTVEPRWSPLFTGESVTLKCEIQSYSNWRYQWYKGSSRTAVYQSQTHTYTIRSAADQDQYWCRGERDDRPTSSQYSNSVTLTVEERPTPVVSIQPDEQGFSGEKVTLRCDIQGGGVSNWEYSWSKEGSSTPVSNVQQYSISSVTQSHSGTYTCRGTVRGTSRYSHTNDVTLTVSALPSATLTVHPDSRVFTGESVTLRCVINAHGGWTYQWYKLSKQGGWTAVYQSEYHTVNGDTLTIRGGAVINGDQYCCRGRRRDRPTSSQYSNTVTLTVEALPSATLTVHPDSRVFTGESVTLTCVINTHGGWTYQWCKLSKQGGWTVVYQSESDSVNRDTFTISEGAVNDGDQYHCRGERRDRPTSSQDSDSITLTVEALPSATLTVHPDSRVFTGESVTLTCVINTHGGWTYQWCKLSKQGGWTVVYQSESDSVNRDTFTISEGAVNDGDQYHCRGERRDRPTSSQDSDSITLTVEALPSATLTVHPESCVFTGESVTLTCEINAHGGWRYQWYKQSEQGGWTVVYQSESDPVNRDTLTISGGAVINGDQYHCRGGRRDRPTSSQDSDSITLTVEALPRATLTVEPRWSPLFTGESVTLKCEIQSYSDWRYQWYKGSSGTAVSQSQTNTYTIRSAADQDQYWCRGERDNRPTSSQNSRTVTLTVEAERPKPELTSSHKGAAALIGNPVVLNCRLDQSAGWRFYWSKHTQNPENETKTETPSYTFSSVSVSDGGQYWCRAGRGDPVYYTNHSDALWINTTGVPLSVSLMVSPSRTQHFTTDPLSLSCEGQSESTGWRVRRYTHSEEVSDCSSGWGSVTGSTCSISSLYTSHTGVYWCESESGGSSDPVNITVHSESTLSESGFIYNLNLRGMTRTQAVPTGAAKCG